MSSRHSGASKVGGSSKRNADNANSNMGYDVEQQFILRLPPAPASRLATEIDNGMSMKDRLGLVFNQDMRHIEVRYGAKAYPGKLVDLPCVIESLKTTDKKTFYKTGDICQMLICREEDDEEEEKRKKAEQDLSPRKKEKMAEKQFIHNHGVTPPLKNVRKKRFRKTMKKKFLDMPEIEKEVKRLLRVDLEAQEVKWEVVFEDDNQPPSQTPQPPSSQSAPRVKEENIESLKIPVEDSQTSTSTKAVKDSVAKSSEIFGYLSSDEEEEEEVGLKVETTTGIGQETLEGGETDGSILERACRMALTEEDLMPFTETSGADGGLEINPAITFSTSDGAEYDTGVTIDSETENRLHERMVELTGEIERLKAFINVRESQLPNLDHEKFRERLQQDIDSYNEQLSECRREFERLSGQLEAISRSRS